MAQLSRINSEHKTFAKDVLNVENAAARLYFDFARRGRVEPHQLLEVHQLPTLQKMLGPGASYRWNSPYPWLSNPGHACYLNSVVRCLFHCSPARQYLRDAVDTNPVVPALKQLLDAYVNGSQNASQAAPRHWDVFVPHELLD